MHCWCRTLPIKPGGRSQQSSLHTIPHDQGCISSAVHLDVMFIQTAFYTRSVRTSWYIVEDVRISCSVWSAVAATVPLASDWMNSVILNWKHFNWLIYIRDKKNRFHCFLLSK